MRPATVRKYLFQYGLFFLLLLLYSVVYYGEVITRLPFGMHDWAQADRFSLALSYFDNHLHFFKPATSNLFSEGGITGVEFPLQAYLAACLGYIFGRGQIPACFRILDIAIMWTGLLYLYRAGLKRTGDVIFSLVPPLFLFCSPVFIFYGGNFLPDPAAVSISFIAFFFLFNYLYEEKQKDLIATVFWFTFAGLIKTTVVLFLIATLAFLFFRSIKRKNNKHAWIVLVSGILSAFVLLGWFLYARYLNRTYHSGIFLSAAAPFEGRSEFIAYVETWFKQKWMGEYLVLPQYLFLSMTVVTSFYLMALQKERSMLILTILYLLAAVSGLLLMGHQMLFHDYYIIAMAFPFVGFALLSAMIAIHRQVKDKVALRSLRISLFTAIQVMFFFADNHNYQRLQPVSRVLDYTDPDAWMHGGAKVLDSLHIPSQQRIGVLSESAPNLALVHFDRKGFHFPDEQWGHNIREISRQLRQRHADVLICHDSLARIYIAENPDYFADYDTLAISGHKLVLRMK